MAFVNEPTKWSLPLGADADVNELPTEADDTTGKASFKGLFPPLTSVPIESGGIAPDRLDLNALFKLIGEDIYFLQHGGVFSYDETLDYEVGALVLFEGNFYKCIQANEHTAPESPLNTAYWSLILDISNVLASIPLKGIWLYLETKDFTVGDVAYYKDNYFKCIQDNGPTSSVVRPDDPQGPNYWEQWLAGGGSGAGSDLLLKPRITSPTEGETDVNTFTVFTYTDIESLSANVTVTGVQLQITDMTHGFDNPVYKYETSNQAVYSLDEQLAAYTQYRVRVRATTNQTGVFSQWSDIVNFTTGDTAKLLRPTISCNENVEATSNQPIFTVSDIQTTGGAPADTLRSCQAWIETAGGEAVYTFTPQTTLSFTVPVNVLQTSTDYVFYAQQTGNLYGNSPVAMLAFTTDDQFARIVTPSITSPVANSSFVLSSGLTLQSSAFTVDGGSDTHASTNWKLGKGTASNYTVLFDFQNNSNLRQLILSASQLTGAGVAIGDNLVPLVSYNGTTLGTSEWSAPFVITAAADPVVLTVSPTSVSTIVGGTASFSVSTNQSSYNVSSSNVSVASVSKSGNTVIVTGKAAGSTTVVVTAGSATRTVSVSVIAPRGEIVIYNKSGTAVSGITSVKGFALGTPNTGAELNFARQDSTNNAYVFVNISSSSNSQGYVAFPIKNVTSASSGSSDYIRFSNGIRIGSLTYTTKTNYTDFSSYTPSWYRG